MTEESAITPKSKRKRKRSKSSLRLELTKEELDVFRARCKELNLNHLAFMREMFIAFNENRLKIKHSEEQIEKIRSVYDDL